MTHAPTSQGFHVRAGLEEAHLRLAAEGYWAAFGRKLRCPLGPEDKAIPFFERVIEPSHAISAVSETGAFLGVAGFKTPEGAFVGGGFSDLVAAYGFGSALVRAALVSVLERPCEDGTLLMDGIFVQDHARGQGVGGALLQAIEDHARAEGLARVRLGVIDTNPRAKALYERRGYEAQGTQSLGVLSKVFGFSHALTMIKPVS